MAFCLSLPSDGITSVLPHLGYLTLHNCEVDSAVTFYKRGNQGTEWLGSMLMVVQAVLKLGLQSEGILIPHVMIIVGNYGCVSYKSIG